MYPRLSTMMTLAAIMKLSRLWRNLCTSKVTWAHETINKLIFPDENAPETRRRSFGEKAHFFQCRYICSTLFPHLSECSPHAWRVYIYSTLCANRRKASQKLLIPGESVLPLNSCSCISFRQFHLLLVLSIFRHIKSNDLFASRNMSSLSFFNKPLINSPNANQISNPNATMITVCTLHHAPPGSHRSLLRLQKYLIPYLVASSAPDSWFGWCC